MLGSQSSLMADNGSTLDDILVNILEEPQLEEKVPNRKEKKWKHNQIDSVQADVMEDERKNRLSSKRTKKKRTEIGAVAEVRAEDVTAQVVEEAREESAYFTVKKRRTKEIKDTSFTEGGGKEDEVEQHHASKPTNKKRKKKQIDTRPTVSIAVAGSIIDNAQTKELATVLAGQIARAATIFRVDEIVVFDDDNGGNKMHCQDAQETAGSFMVRILEYLEVPQYLRKALIPRHNSLNSAGRLPPLDAPHHLRRHEKRPYREGVVLDKITPTSSCSYVDVGLNKEVLVNQSSEPGTRVTVAMGHAPSDNVLQVVSCETIQQVGMYWGYKVRHSSCLSEVFDKCPFKDGYDYRIGTSEHGEKVKPSELVIPNFKHLLIAFGGLAGLEESLELDNRLQVTSITSLFDLYLNTCPNQGSRTIRTEEAILISLQYLQDAIQRATGAR